jgi:hypothetical protein
VSGIPAHFRLGGDNGGHGFNYFSWGVEGTGTRTTPGTVNNAMSMGSLKTPFWVQPNGASDHNWFANTSPDNTVFNPNGPGAQSIRFDVHTNDGGNQQMGPQVLDLIPFGFNIVGAPAIYYRWWMRISPGFLWGVDQQKAKSQRTAAQGNPSSRGWTSYVWKGGFRISECDGDGGCTIPGGGGNNDFQGIDFDLTTMEDGQWHEYIIMIKANSTPTTPDAEFRVAIDGVEVPNSPWRNGSGVTGFILHAHAGEAWLEGWGSWMCLPYFQLGGTGTQTPAGTIWCDDFSVDGAWYSLKYPIVF